MLVNWFGKQQVYVVSFIFVMVLTIQFYNYITRLLKPFSCVLRFVAILCFAVFLYKILLELGHILNYWFYIFVIHYFRLTDDMKNNIYKIVDTSIVNQASIGTLTANNLAIPLTGILLIIFGIRFLKLRMLCGKTLLFDRRIK